MAYHGFKKKPFRLLTTRNVLFAVPSVWILIIVYTVYSTSVVQQEEYHRQVAELERQHQQQRKRHPPVTLWPHGRQGQRQGDGGQSGGQGGGHRGVKVEDEWVLEKRKKLLSDSLKKKQAADRRKAEESRNNNNNKHHGGVVEMQAVDDHVEYVPKGGTHDRKVIKPGVRVDPPKHGAFGWLMRWVHMFFPGLVMKNSMKGEQGTAVVYDPRHLNATDRARYDLGWTNHQYNEFASLHISTQRATQDFRNNACKAAQYAPVTSLPRVSIIICFYNEAWSVLVRTVHSVLSRSPPELVEEIILVDDYSDMEPMKHPLEELVSSLSKLRLLRMKGRSGLVKARLAGVRQARAEVVLFLDSHVECAEGWLTPLLHTMSTHPTVAVTPEIDVIDHKTFAIQPAIDNIGILDFRSFSFDWSPILPRLQAKRSSEADLIESPTMAGGLFAIRKDYFIKLGTYDPDLELWGGENIELSLKLWQCGGGIMIHPCSRVAHIFRDQSPYLKGRHENVLSKNSARVAQVWADDFRSAYFRGGSYDEATYGSVSERQQLRKDLGCKSFSWYVDNIYPEMYVEGTGQYVSHIRDGQGLCLTGVPDGTLAWVPCETAMVFELTRVQGIRFRGQCLDNQGPHGLRLQDCDSRTPPSQRFEYTKTKYIRHPASDTCLTSVPHRAALMPCTHGPEQVLHWDRNPNYIP